MILFRNFLLYHVSNFNYLLIVITSLKYKIKKLLIIYYWKYSQITNNGHKSSIGEYRRSAVIINIIISTYTKFIKPKFFVSE